MRKRNSQFNPEANHTLLGILIVTKLIKGILTGGDERLASESVKVNASICAIIKHIA